MTNPERTDHNTETTGGPSWSVRLATDHDHTELLDLRSRSTKRTASPPLEMISQRTSSTSIHSVDAHVVVYEFDGRLQAFAITTKSFGLENGPIAELEDIYVSPAYRRRGVAELLINDAADWAGRQGATHIEVVTAPNGNDISRLNAYYEARGFVGEGRQIRTRPLRAERDFES